MKAAEIPSFFYGTAWKKARTTELTSLALEAGFRAIDTANQLKHYDEAAVGEAVKQFFKAGNSRDSLFLQTKFTSIDGQDHRLPYDPKAPLKTQVRQSFESSLSHFGVEYLDSYVLHGPYNHPGLGDEDWEVWEAIEALHAERKAGYIGISNVNAAQLSELARHAKTKPHFVQNRCYATRGWDGPVRELCKEFGLRYQGFSLLTANPYEMQSPAVGAVCERLGILPAQVIFAFARHVGMIPLTGTSNRDHMQLDLASIDAALLPAEIAAIETVGQ